ncbi:MAG TPA: alpha/beta hydrolase, partial [Kofleriaceae bacterium]
MSAAYTTGRARVGEVELVYDRFGAQGIPLILIMGIGAQRMMWDDDFCGQLVARGFCVVRFDHRDIGESSRVDAPVPSPAPMLARRLVGAAIRAPYTLSDMA